MSEDSWLRPLAPIVRCGLGRARTFWLYETCQRWRGYPDLLAMYKKKTGRAPNLKEPVSFSEKITWLKLNDKNPSLPVVTDKVSARSWIAERVGEEFLIPIVGVFESAASLKRAQLPQQFIAKINNGSGRNIIVRDKDELDWDVVCSQLGRWLRETQMYALMEWYHHQSPPRIVVEPLLLDPDGRVPTDYKFFVFDGRVKCVYDVRDRFHNQNRTLYRPDWEVIPVLVEGRPSIPTSPPGHLEQMVEIAEALGRGFPFMRVDTYCHQGRVYVGEMTPHPNSGMCEFTPSSFDLELGTYLDLARFRGRYWEAATGRP